MQKVLSKRASTVKSRTLNFNIENNLKMTSDKVDKEFYNGFMSAVKSACN